MKQMIWIPFVLLLGLVLGGWGPRHDLKAARLEIERLRAGGGNGKGTTFKTVTDLIRLPDRTTDSVAISTNKLPSEVASDPEPIVNPEGSPLSTDKTHPSGVPTEPDMREQITEAMELWRVRSDMARNGFLARTQLNPEQTAQFDLLIAAMNLRLRHTLTETAERIQAGEEQNTESAIRIMNKLSGALTLTYDEMDRTLPAEWRMTEDGSLDLTDFIDPSVMEPLIPVQNELEWGRNRQRHGHRASP